MNMLWFIQQALRKLPDSHSLIEKLLAILKKRLNLDQSLYTILQFLSVSIFEKTPISEAFSQEFYKTKTSDYDNQLLLFNL